MRIICELLFNPNSVHQMAGHSLWGLTLNIRSTYCEATIGHHPICGDGIWVYHVGTHCPIDNCHLEKCHFQQDRPTGIFHDQTFDYVNINSQEGLPKVIAKNSERLSQRGI
jgi:hypothetical protein